MTLTQDQQAGLTVPLAIGSRIRTIRRRQERSLQAIADICGFTRSLLSKIETGKTMPPIATLMKIAGALGVRMAALLGDDDETTTVYTPRAAGERLIATEKGYRFFPFAAERLRKAMQPFLFVAVRGQIQPQPLQHAGEEFLYMLEGEMAYRVGAVSYHLHPGDTLYFDAQIPHDLTPLTEHVVYLAVFWDSCEENR